MGKREKPWIKKIQPKWLSENQILDSFLNASTEDIDSRSIDNEEEGVETVVWRCSAAGSVENMFLDISQNSQGNTCARVYFLISCKPQAF